jgi:fibronectin type 3 domain-containing protein
VINRVGWDGFIQPIEPKEMGWKETVMMSPLEDIIVAVRAKKPKLDGFGVPLSERLMDPTQPEGSPFGFTQIDAATGNPAVVTNALKNFGWEYVWHCHILGHEENDFMRPISFNANEGIPAAPLIIGATVATNGAATLNWADNSDSEYKFDIQRADAVLPAAGGSPTFGAYASVGTALANATTYIDTTAVPGLAPVAGTPEYIDPVTGAVTPAVPGTNGSAYGYIVVAIGSAGSTPSAPQLTPIALSPATPPSNLAVTGTSGSQVALTWADNSNNEAGFLIERSVSGGAFTPLNPTTQIAVVAGQPVLVNLPQNTTSFVNAGLLPNTVVSYRVAAGNIAGQTAYTNTVNTVTNSAPTVGSVVATAASASSVTLSWSLTQLTNTTNSAVTGYVVTRASAAGQVQFNVTGATASYTDNTAVQNTAYTYTVAAVNTAGMSAVQGIAGVSNSITTPYAAVGALAAINATASAAGLASSVTVKWTAATPATQYLVERAPGLGSVSGFALLASPTTVPVGGYIDTTVAPLTQYTYRVTAQNGSPTNAVTQTTSVTTNAAIVVTPPSGLTASAPNFTSGATTLTWTDQATNETGFVVQSSADGINWTNVGGQVAPRTGTTGLTRTLNVIAPLGTTTSYRVLALNLTAGITTYSAPSASVNVVTVLAAPSSLTAAIATATRISLNWVDNSIGETSFRIFRNNVQVGTVNRSAAQAAATGGALVTFNDNTVVAGNTYSYTVFAANGAVLSPVSNEASVVFAAPATPAPLAAVPTRVVGSTTRSNVALSWAAATPGVTFTVQRITPNGGGTTTLLTNSTATSFTDLNLRRNTAAYIYQIRTNAGPLSSVYVQTSVVVN